MLERHLIDLLEEMMDTLQAWLKTRGTLQKTGNTLHEASKARCYNSITNQLFNHRYHLLLGAGGHMSTKEPQVGHQGPKIVLELFAM